MKTKVKLKDGNTGYIDGYYIDDRAVLTAIIVVDNQIIFEPVSELEVIISKKKVIKKFDVESVEYKLAKLMFDCIKRLNPNHKDVNLNQWSNDIDLILRIDKRTPEEVIALLKHIYNDSFWAKNILSPNKLREKYDKLVTKFIVENKTISEPLIF